MNQEVGFPRRESATGTSEFLELRDECLVLDAQALRDAVDGAVLAGHAAPYRNGFGREACVLQASMQRRTAGTGLPLPYFVVDGDVIHPDLHRDDGIGILRHNPSDRLGHVRFADIAQRRPVLRAVAADIERDDFDAVRHHRPDHAGVSGMPWTERDIGKIHRYTGVQRIDSRVRGRLDTEVRDPGAA
ncbi:hypothetical protein [Nocardia beijingensis]